jgi:putative flippase GtrA
MTFLRYLFVQVLAYVVDMCIFLIFLNWVASGPICANIFSKISAGFFAFMVQRKFTFKVASNELIQRQAFRYFTVLIINIPIASAILFLILLLISDKVIAKISADIVGVGISYLFSKYFIFSTKQNHIENFKWHCKR